MNHVCSKIEAALTLTDEVYVQARRQACTTPADVIHRNTSIYQLECALKFLRDAFFEQTAIAGKTN